MHQGNFFTQSITKICVIINKCFICNKKALPLHSKQSAVS